MRNKKKERMLYLTERKQRIVRYIVFIVCSLVLIGAGIYISLH